MREELKEIFRVLDKDKKGEVRTTLYDYCVNSTIIFAIDDFLFIVIRFVERRIFDNNHFLQSRVHK